NAAIGYVQNHWEALIRYASSGYLAIDNNLAEQHMKTVATGRKNWLFTGSENGGKTMAVLFSVVSSCQRRGHDPFVSLGDVLTRLPDLSKEHLADLLPDRWTPPGASSATSSMIRPGGAEAVDSVAIPGIIEGARPHAGRVGSSGGSMAWAGPV